MSLNSLDKIRQQFRAPEKDLCPNCRHPLTIESTPFFTTKLCESCFEFSRIDEVEGCCIARDLRFVRLLIEGGGIQIRQQCVSCGWCSGKSHGGFTGEQISNMPYLDKDMRDGFDNKKYGQRREFLKKVSENKSALKRETWFSQYNDYLKSPVWQEKRDAVLKRDKYLCQCCLESLATQVHHRSYEFVDMNGSEPAFDLVSVCSPCHIRIETIKKEQRKIG